MADQTRNEGWDSAPKYISGFLIGAIVFVAGPGTARWLHGGAFAQSAPVPGSPNIIQNNQSGPNIVAPGGQFNFYQKPAPPHAEVTPLSVNKTPEGFLHQVSVHIQSDSSVGTVKTTAGDEHVKFIGLVITQSHTIINGGRNDGHSVELHNLKDFTLNVLTDSEAVPNLKFEFE